MSRNCMWKNWIPLLASLNIYFADGPLLINTTRIFLAA